MRTRLKEKEKEIFVTRQHWYYLVTPFLLSVLILIVDIFLYLNTGFGFALSFIIFCAVLIYLVFKVFERKNNIWVVTNLRLIDEEGVFTVKVKESPIDKINNVSYVQSLMGRMLNFGDVEIQTAAEQGATIYNGLNFPRELSESITTAQEDYKHSLFNSALQNREGTMGGEEDLIECPYCAEKIKAKAKICRFCGKELVPGSNKG